jgi:PPOX class probable F420-dependent enzyme
MFAGGIEPTVSSWKETGMAVLDDQARAALEGKHFWSVATASRAGVPQSTVMWVMLRDGRIVLNSALGRKKVDNLRENPHVALSWADPDNPYVSYGIQGRVVDELVGEQAEADIDALAQKYLGEERYPWRKPGEERVTFLVEPTHVYRQG